MESHNPPMVAKKKVWKVIRIVLLMLRKKISKSKLLLELHHLMSKRGKMIEKLLENLTFHHHHHHSTFAASNDYEFSCSNSPAVAPFSFHHEHNFFYDLPSPFHEITTVAALHSILEMLNSNGDITETASSSPVLPGFGSGRSPMVRQLRITDSPFPLNDKDHMNSQVDRQAEEFIEKFYDQLRLQKKSTSH